MCIGHLKIFTRVHLSERLKVNYNRLLHGHSDNNRLQHVLEKVVVSAMQPVSIISRIITCYSYFVDIVYGLKFINPLNTELNPICQ
jgi:hypothetical protein